MELTRQLQKRVEVSSSNSHQMSPSALATLDSVECRSDKVESRTSDKVEPHQTSTILIKIFHNVAASKEYLTNRQIIFRF